MGQFSIGKGKDFYKEQLGYLGTNDIEGLLQEHYHPDAVMVTFDGIRRGHAELRQYFVNTLSSMGQITELSTQYFAETEDVIIFKATITDSKRGTVHADNALYLKDGKIHRHIALTILPQYDYTKLGTLWTD
ncbi:MAG: nuclear transport factor 2 family protein [Thermodesulfobacteriota bacterium]